MNRYIHVDLELFQLTFPSDDRSSQCRTSDSLVLHPEFLIFLLHSEHPNFASPSPISVIKIGGKIRVRLTGMRRVATARGNLRDRVIRRNRSEG